MKKIDGWLTAPQGFIAAGVKAGIKASGNHDVAVIYSTAPAVSGAVFTQNKMCAAPVLVSREVNTHPCAQAIVVNSGCANACTGEQGLKDAKEMQAHCAGLLGVKPEEVFVCSTGVIGQFLPMDKLLTGFDAPSCTYLYIDKAMHDHGLFQAICRVNRLDGESKDFGYIVDYKELFGELTDAMNKYTAGAFEAYDQEDVEGLLKDRSEEAKKYFENTLDELDELCEGVEYPGTELDYIHYFCGESGIDEDQDEAYARIREKLYKLVGRLIRAYAELKPRMNEAGYSPVDQEKLEARVAFYISLRETIGRASGDFIDLKAYEPGMRYLIDNYISASESQKIGSMDDFTLLDFILTQEDKLGNEDDKGEQESAAETIENNIRKKVVERMVINPAYYAKMSAILEQLILDRRRGVIAYGQLLETYMELAKNVTKPEDNSKYPDSIRSNGALRALYDNCGEDEKQAIRLHKAIVKARQEGFRNNPVKENKIKRALYQILNDEDEVERIYQIVVEQEEY